MHLHGYRAVYGAQTACHPHSTSTSASYPYENGDTHPYYHTAVPKDKGGDADCPNGQPCKTDAEGAAAVTSCQQQGCGAATITIGGTGSGAGFNVGFTPANGTSIVFDDEWYYSNNCTGYVLNALTGPPACAVPNPPQPPYSPESGQSWYWNTTSCSWQQQPNNSPVAIDVKGNRWEQEELFTDLTKGDYVSFDIHGDGIVQKLSWPKWKSGVGWLVLDVDGDGVIKNGLELFGNFTAHSDGGVANNPGSNGFLALAWWDRPEQGGNGDLIISKLDAVWPKLKLWFPGQHCYQDKNIACHSRPDELHGLEEYGLTSINLVYTGRIWEDKVGNVYKFQTILNPLAETVPGHGENHQKSNDSLGRTSYNVWLKAVN